MCQRQMHQAAKRPPNCPERSETRQEIGETTSKLLERIEFPYVLESACTKYACRKCQGHVVVAPGVDRVLDRCMLGPNFRAQIVFDRFGNHMLFFGSEEGTKGSLVLRSLVQPCKMSSASARSPTSAMS